MLPYRKCVAIVVIRNGKIFVGRRIDIKTAWQLPQGGVEEGEDLQDAAKRELFEETGISSVELLGTSVGHRYDFPPNVRNIIARKRGQLEYVGQEMSFLAFKFCGDESEIDLSKPPREFADWQWMSPDDLIRGIIYFKKDSYVKAIGEFQRQNII